MKFENLITLIDAVSASQLTEFKYEEDSVKIELSKKERKVQVVSPTVPAVEYTGVPLPAVPAVSAEETAEPQEKPDGKIVESPLVGTFFAAPSEDAAPYVSVGDTVKKGQTLAIVEAMKLMNEIESDYDGTITEILVENGQAVEYGQPLFRIM